MVFAGHDRDVFNTGVEKGAKSRAGSDCGDKTEQTTTGQGTAVA